MFIYVKNIMLTRIFHGFHEHTIGKYCSENLDFLLKTKTRSHYFQNFCVTKFYRTSRIKQTFCIESTSMCIFVLRQDVSKLIENPVEPFQSSVTFLQLMKTSENLWFSEGTECDTGLKQVKLLVLISLLLCRLFSI